MKLFAFALLLAAACGGPKSKGSPMVNEGSGVSDNCCCKSSPATSEDGKPIYESNINRMECSTKQGECVPDVQCNGASDSGSTGSTSTPPAAPGMTKDGVPLPPPQ